MKFAISVNAAALQESLKSAQNYIQKDAIGNDPLAHIVFKYLQLDKKMAVIACDGHGYFERRLEAKISRKDKSQKDQPLCITGSDAQMLAKMISARATGSVKLEIEDSNMRAILPNGSITQIKIATDVQLPDYAGMRAKAEKGKKATPKLSNVVVPVHEMLRAGKSLPAKAGAVARMFTANDTMALLECFDESIDIRIIFTFARIAEAV